MSRELPRIASPSASPSSAGAHEPAAPLADEERQQDDDRRQQLVEQLAVDVDVVPDEVRTERRHDRSDEPRAMREEPPPRLVDDEGREGRDGDLREADRPPLAPRGPVDRDQEERVERLRPGRGLAGEEPERSVVDERARELVALLGERLEDVVAFVEEDGEPRHDRRRRDDDVCLAPCHASR